MILKEKLSELENQKVSSLADKAKLEGIAKTDICLYF